MDNKILKLNREQRRRAIYHKGIFPLGVIMRKDEEGKDTKEILAYLHPRKGYKGNAKGIEMLKSKQKSRGK